MYLDESSGYQDDASRAHYITQGPEIKDPNNHNCPYCPHEAESASGLKTHLMSHGSDRPYTCPHCPKAFRRQGHLTEHLRIHTGERPYACTLCPYRATKVHLLKRHVLRIHRVDA